MSELLSDLDVGLLMQSIEPEDPFYAIMGRREAIVGRRRAILRVARQVTSHEQ